VYILRNQHISQRRQYTSHHGNGYQMSQSSHTPSKIQYNVDVHQTWPLLLQSWEASYVESRLVSTTGRNRGDN